jgi:hypothetical protein
MSLVAGGITEPSGGATAMTGATACTPYARGAVCGCPNKLTPWGGIVTPNDPEVSGGLEPNVEPNAPNAP